MAVYQPDKYKQCITFGIPVYVKEDSGLDVYVYIRAIGLLEDLIDKKEDISKFPSCSFSFLVLVALCFNHFVLR